MRRKQICFVADDQDGCGEFAVTVCGLSILNARITRDQEQVSCSLCKIQMEIDEARQFPEDTMPDEQTDDMGFPFPKYESDSDPTPDDIDLIPYFLENA